MSNAISHSEIYKNLIYPTNFSHYIKLSLKNSSIGNVEIRHSKTLSASGNKLRTARADLSGIRKKLGDLYHGITQKSAIQSKKYKGVILKENIQYEENNFVHTDDLLLRGGLESLNFRINRYKEYKDKAPYKRSLHLKKSKKACDIPHSFDNSIKHAGISILEGTSPIYPNITKIRIKNRRIVYRAKSIYNPLQEKGWDYGAEPIEFSNEKVLIQ